MNLRDRVIWVTGASSGIGAAVCIALSRKQARLVLSSRNTEELERVRSQCLQPERHCVQALDLAQETEMASIVERVRAERGRIDVLVNSAGVSQRAFALKTGEPVERDLMQVNYFGTVALSKAVATVMKSQGSGRIVVVSSMVGKFSTPRRSAYAASKHALHGYFDALRAELWGSGVGITLVMPGYIRTRLSLNALIEDGTPQGSMDRAQQHGIEATDCADRIVGAIEKNRDEIIVAGLRERLAYCLSRYWPALFRRVIRRARVT